MARGWESKSVEAQQTEKVTSSGNPKLTPEEVERKRKYESLELSRGRVARELESARTEVHRTALRNAMAFLDEEMGKLR